MGFPSKRGSNSQLIEGKRVVRRGSKTLARELDALSYTRISPNFLLRELLYSTESAAMGLPNMPEDPGMVIRSGKALAERVLEPVLERWGRFWITFGYQCRAAIEADMSAAQRAANPRGSNPHMWDRLTHGEAVYARVDLWPKAVEDGLVSKYDFGRWMMATLDIDLLMIWRRSNVFCVTISDYSPRRVWLEWCPHGEGDNDSNKIEHMGRTYWRDIYPTLPEHERPKFGPSCTGGSMQWRHTR
ncbi:MAG: hypothetical protein JSR19_09695 [Proteobacteria bacterium]|nr:hypothetical protein [Pseudomonadota bacterium]HQR04011.1 hypothetical protein [Rhodocyclaceae bacterium]